MPIWSELELFCRAIREEVEREVRDIRERAESEALSTVSEAKRRADQRREMETLALRSKAHDEARRLLDGAELEAKRRVMAFREEVVREVLGELERKLRSFHGSPGVVDFLVKGIQEAIGHLPGNTFVVEMTEDDCRLMKDRMGEPSQERNVQLEMRASSSIEGGVRVYTGDGRQLYDNSVAARLKRHEREIRQEIWRELFGTDKGDI